MRIGFYVLCLTIFKYNYLPKSGTSTISLSEELNLDYEAAKPFFFFIIN